MNRERIAERIFDITFELWCFFDIILRTAFGDRINDFLRNVVWDNTADINKVVDVTVLFLLMCIIVFFQRYSYKELIVLALITVPVILGTIKADNNYLISVLLFVVAARYVNMDKIIKIYFIILLIMIPFVIIMCMMGSLPDYTMYRGGQIRHALGFEHPNRLGMRIFQLSACFCYVMKNSVHNIPKFIIMGIAAYFVYKVPNSQTAFIGIFILMFMVMIGGIYDRYGIDKKRLMNIVAIGAVVVNVFSVWLSFFDPAQNALLLSLDKFLSRRFYFGHKMYKYYGITLWGQKVSTLVKDKKYVGIYHQWYLDNAYLSILLRFGIVVYIVFSLLLAFAIFYYVKQENYTMVAILFTYSVYGIMTTGFYMMSHNIFLLTITSPLYMKAGISGAKKRYRRFKIVWGL